MNSQITRLIFTETGTYNDMTVRPYNTFIEAHDVLSFQEATQGGRNMSAQAVASVSNVLRPSAEHEGIVGISDGWNSRRLRFMMEVTHSGVMGGHVRQYLTGYTDHFGLTSNLNLAPEMRLHFNNTMTVRGVQEVQPGMGAQMRLTVSDASHLIHGNYNPGFNVAEVGQRTMRPQDVFATMGHQVLGSTDVMDLRTTFAGGMMKSRRNNGTASNYLSRTLAAYNQAYQNDSNSVNDMGQLLDTASGSVQEGLVTQDGFIAELIRMSVTGIVETGTVTYGELCRLQPGLDNMVDVFPITPAYRQTNYIHQAGDSENWTGSTMETIMATALTHSVPSLMTDMMLTGIHFRTTNQTLNGEPFTQIMGIQSFTEGVDLTPQTQHFIYRLETEVMRTLSRNNQIDFAIEMRADLLGDTDIKIAIGGQPQVTYCAAQFADALMAPVITNHGATLERLAHDIEHLVGNIDTNLTSNTQPTGGLTHGFSTTL